ncbi:basic-leucine zipper transcription factor f-related [Anaeramoeba flamelloides]|uniref:Basic-leucine zipper transcription factor f-related n=1 Tax=Anaeramoeba flamelloides TaxID=1746091 RepID=A0ABQ8YV83_9EUKA|nr:basic-leucine zipper transcription factor f-related [Anaeramoeba flamelloides]
MKFEEDASQQLFDYFDNETDFDPNYDWDLNNFFAEDKNHQRQSKSERNKQPQKVKLLNHLTIPLSFSELSPNSEMVLDFKQIKDSDFLNATELPLPEEKMNFTTALSVESNHQQSTFKVAKKSIGSTKKKKHSSLSENHKSSRKRTTQINKLTQPKTKTKTKIKPKSKTKPKPKLKTETNKQTNEQTNKETNGKPEIKKNNKKVDWLNVGVKLSEKEKTLLKRLSGKKNRDLSEPDRLEWKRLRDRISARNSRQKKRAHVTDLESKVVKLQSDKIETDQKLSDLELENQQLRSEINRLQEIITRALRGNPQSEKNCSLNSNTKLSKNILTLNNCAKGDVNDQLTLDLLY